jgi:hypothetical protein
LTSQELNKQYAILCQELGHLTVNRIKIDERLAEIHQAIKVINEYAAHVKVAESQAAWKAKGPDGIK